MSPADYDAAVEQTVAELPEGPGVVWLIGEPKLDWVPEAVVDLASRSGATRAGHTLLVNLEAGDSRLDGVLGAAGRPGLPEVFEGRQALKDVALPIRERKFIYVPAGPAAPGARRLMPLPAWRRFVDGAVGRGATVMLYVPLAQHPVAEAPLVESVVLLGGDASRLELPDAAAVLRLRGGPGDGAGSRAERIHAIRRSSGRGEPGRVSRHRRALVIAVVLLATLLVIGGFALIAANRASEERSFLRQNDPLWERAVEPGALPDSLRADSLAPPQPPADSATDR